MPHIIQLMQMFKTFFLFMQHQLLLFLMYKNKTFLKRNRQTGHWAYLAVYFFVFQVIIFLNMPKDNKI